MKEKILTPSSYGLCLFSTATLLDFFKNNSIRSKKLLEVFSKPHELYLQSLAEGIWLPILPISAIKYTIKCGEGEQFDADWQPVLCAEGFNIAVGNDNAFWITCKSAFPKFEAITYTENVTGFKCYDTLDGVTIYNAFKINVLEGKYLVNIHGFKRKKELDYPNSNHGYWFELQPISAFNAYNDPREDDKYNFITD